MGHKSGRKIILQVICLFRKMSEPKRGVGGGTGRRGKEGGGEECVVEGGGASPVIKDKAVIGWR